MSAREKGNAMEHYRCPYCGYVYDSSQGDGTQGAPPGTAFHDVPNGWRCPGCYTDHSAFEPWPAPPQT